MKVHSDGHRDVLGGGLILYPRHPTLDAYITIFRGAIVTNAVIVSTGLAVIALFNGVAHWNDFFAATLYLNDSTKWPIQLVLRQYVLQGSVLAGSVTPDPSQPAPPAQTIQMAGGDRHRADLDRLSLLATLFHQRRPQRRDQGLTKRGAIARERNSEGTRGREAPRSFPGSR